MVAPVWGPIGMLTEDVDEARRSFRKLAGLAFQMAVFGHGRPVVGDAAARFRQSLGRLGG